MSNNWQVSQKNMNIYVSVLYNIRMNIEHPNPENQSNFEELQGRNLQEAQSIFILKPFAASSICLNVRFSFGVFFFSS